MTGNSTSRKIRSNSIEDSDDEGFSVIPLPHLTSVSSKKFEPLSKMAPGKLYSIIMWWRLSRDELKTNGYPALGRMPGGSVFPMTPWNERCYVENGDPSRRCARCATNFILNWNEPRIANCCVYHHRPQLNLETGERLHPCCNEFVGESQGCMTSDTHVSTVTVQGTFLDFVVTEEPKNEGDSRSKKVYGLDAEFVYTYNGMEVARVSLVDMKGRVVLDTFVLPQFEILDFNTAFSGIEPHHMEQAISLKECQQQLLELINEETILVGHSLEFDLRGLRICHFSIIDTALLFLDRQSGCKPALRNLTASLLNRNIQENKTGHCSIEDAKACLDLLSKRYEMMLKNKCL